MKAKKTLRQLFDGGQRKSNERSLSGDRVKKALAQKRVYRTASVLACVVAFATTYMLILPAITVEKADVEDQLAGVTVSESVEGVGGKSGVDVAGENADLGATGNADSSETGDIEPGDLLLIADENLEDSQTHIGIVVDQVEGSETGQTFSVIEKDPEEGVVLTEVSLEDPTVTIVGTEEATEYSGLGTEVIELISAAQEEELLGEEETAELEVEVENTLAELGVETEEDPSAARENNEGVIQSEDEDSEEESAVTEEDSSVQAVQDDNGVEEQNDYAVIPDEAKDPEDAKDLEAQTAETGISTELDNDIATTTYQVANYLLSYTVDFHWDVDGKNYEYNLPGGGFISLTELVEALGVVGDNGPASLESKALVANIKKVEFSSPKLLSVSKAEEDTTVGAIKDALGLECEYSAELTEEQIEAIDAQNVKAGDWALISLKPFDTDETLMITMNNGDQFVVKVTDATYEASIITELDGKTGALVNLVNYNALQDSEHSYYQRLQATEVTVNTNTISTAELNTKLTKWTFIQVEGAQNQFYIRSENGYLHIYDDPNGEGVGSIGISEQPQALVISVDQNHRIRIVHGNNNAVNNIGNVSSNGYGTWNGSGADFQNPGEWFTVYEVEPTFPVTLHFVKEDGTSFTTGEVTYADGTSVEIDNGNFKINPEKLVVGEDGTIDLNQFLINGYTLSNTHRMTWEDLLSNTKPSHGANAQQPHSIIGNKLKWDNGTLKYQAFYTNSDKAGSKWVNVGYRVGVSDYDAGNNHPGNDVYDGIYDYYLVYSPIAKNNEGGEVSDDPLELGPVGKDKHMTDNEDGTFTLELSVDTKAVPQEEDNKVNVIIVLDTSSSMERDDHDLKQGESKTINGTTYYYNPQKRRMTLTVEALNGKGNEPGFLDELAKFNTTDNPDTVQVALVSFDELADIKSGMTTDIQLIKNIVKGTDQSKPGLPTHQGTNWADALQKVLKIGTDDDPTYVLFMTDGAPSQYWHTPVRASDNTSLLFVDGEGCYLGARDEARAVVASGKNLYSIFSFGTDTDKSNDYLGELVDYAYNSPGIKANKRFYADNVEDLKNQLTSALGVFTEKLAHTNVNIHDGIAMDTTATALSTSVAGKLGGVTYTKTGGKSGTYSVTVDAAGKAVFKIENEDGKDSLHDAEEVDIPYLKLTGTGENITHDSSAKAKVYQCTVEGVTYTMPIASYVLNDETKEGNLNWDLSPLGPLENGANYKVSFVVWPDQKAYDYVADLNNGIKKWNEQSQSAVEANNGTILYYKGGVPEYPNIVRYPDGSFKALTNTQQDVTYYVIKEKTGGDDQGTTYEGIYTVYPETPDPMPLTASKSKVTKVWNVDRDPGILAQLLYNFDGTIKEPHVQYRFDILMDDDSSTTEDDSTNKYTTVNLGWDPNANNGNGAYDWESDSEQDYIMKNRLTGETHTVKIGTRWTKEFSIATGLMLSEERMDELGLDKSAYPSGKYPADQEDGKTYYILEEGHDYTIKEPGLTYEFDFNSPLYHPMLVDGVLQNVTFTKNDSHVTITDMTSEQNGISALVIENTLRGYINLNKVVLDTNGETVLEDDDTKFTYTVVLENSNEPGPFTGDSIPWYGISGLFYHSIDEDGGYHYYQAEPTTSGKLTLTDEDGHTFEATSETFHPDSVGPSEVTYTEGGVSKTIQLYGNQMDFTSDNIVSATLQITQMQTLNIANVPVNTVYTITERDRIGYQFVRIEKEIKVNEADETPESKESFEDGSKTITGTIVANRDNQVTYFNKILNSDITIQKLDEGGKGLSGAIFELKKVDSEQSESYASNIDGVRGLSTISKTINGEQKTFYSSIETTGLAQTISGLPDGTYRLREVYIPDGYVSTYQYVQFDIVNHKMKNVRTDTGDTSKLTFKAADENDLALLQISNTPGAALPSTGGPGTEGFLIIGGLLTIGAAGLLIRRKIDTSE